MDSGLLGVIPLEGERAACRLGCVGAGHSACACAYATIFSKPCARGLLMHNSVRIQNSDLFGNTGLKVWNKTEMWVLVVALMDLLGAGAANVRAKHDVVGRLSVHVGLVEFAVEQLDVGLLLLQGLGGGDLVADLLDVGLLLLQGLGSGDLVADLLGVGLLLLKGFGGGDLVADLLDVPGCIKPGIFFLSPSGAELGISTFFRARAEAGLENPLFLEPEPSSA